MVQAHWHSDRCFQTGATENSRDGFETIRVAMDGLDWIPDPLPPTVLDEKAFFHDLVSKTQLHVQTTLSAFSTAVGLADEQRYVGRPRQEAVQQLHDVPLLRSPA